MMAAGLRKKQRKDRNPRFPVLDKTPEMHYDDEAARIPKG